MNNARQPYARLTRAAARQDSPISNLDLHYKDSPSAAQVLLSGLVWRVTVPRHAPPRRHLHRAAPEKGRHRDLTNALGIMTRLRGQAPGAPARRSVGPLIGIMVGYLAIAVAYSFATRLRWGPDEPGHIAYIESLALDHRFPTLGEEDIYRPGAAISHQVQHPPLYYLLAAVVYRAALPLGEDARIRVLRLFSAALGLVSLWLLWRLSALVVSSQGARFAIVAGLAFLPLFGYMSAVVNNDALLVTLSLASFYIMTTIIAGDDRARRWALLGVLTGSAILTKEVALALLPVLAVGLLLPRGSEGASVGRRLAGVIVAISAALAIAAVWWVRNQILFGHPTIYAYVKPPFRSLGDLLANPYLGLNVAAIWARRSFLTLWAPYWAIRQVLPRTPYLAGTAVVFGTGAIGVVLMWLDHFRGTLRLQRVQAQAMGLMMMFAALVALGVLRYTLLVDYRAVEGGRYMLVTWPYLAVLGAAGYGHLAGRFREAVLLILAALWLVGDLIVLFAVGRTYDVW
jgi:4-amino-4-deoxy-L-arabinose transferase-like glycosyltransferase